MASTVEALTVGLYVRLEAKTGREEEVENFLKGALRLVHDEPETLLLVRRPPRPGDVRDHRRLPGRGRPPGPPLRSGGDGADGEGTGPARPGADHRAIRHHGGQAARRHRAGVTNALSHRPSPPGGNEIRNSPALNNERLALWMPQAGRCLGTGPILDGRRRCPECRRRLRLDRRIARGSAESGFVAQSGLPGPVGRSAAAPAAENHRIASGRSTRRAQIRWSRTDPSTIVD